MTNTLILFDAVANPRELLGRAVIYELAINPAHVVSIAHTSLSFGPEPTARRPLTAVRLHGDPDTRYVIGSFWQTLRRFQPLTECTHP